MAAPTNSFDPKPTVASNTKTNKQFHNDRDTRWRVIIYQSPSVVGIKIVGMRILKKLLEQKNYFASTFSYTIDRDRSNCERNAPVSEGCYHHATCANMFEAMDCSYRDSVKI